MKKLSRRYIDLAWLLTVFFISLNMASAGELIKDRYIKEKQWEYIADKKNKILWQDNLAVKNNNFSWQEAKAYCASLSVSGIKNWRLPTIDECGSIYTFSGQDVDVFKHGSRSGVYSLNIWSLEQGKILNYFDGKVIATRNNEEPRTRCVSDSGYKEIYAIWDSEKRKAQNERQVAENKAKADRAQAITQLLALGARGLYLEAGKAQRNGPVSFVNTRFGANELYEMIVDKFPDSEYAVKATDQLTSLSRSSREQSAAEQSDFNARQRAYEACKIEMNSCYSRTSGKGACYRDCERLR